MLIAEDEKDVSASRPRLRFPKSRRFSKRKDIQAVFDVAERAENSLFRLYTTKTDHGQLGQFAVIISKRSGGAVTRNTCKRRVREWIRTHMNDINPNQHHIIYIKRNIKTIQYTRIHQNLIQLMPSISNQNLKEQL